MLLSCPYNDYRKNKKKKNLAQFKMILKCPSKQNCLIQHLIMFPLALCFSHITPSCLPQLSLRIDRHLSSPPRSFATPVPRDTHHSSPKMP